MELPFKLELLNLYKKNYILRKMKKAAMERLNHASWNINVQKVKQYQCQNRTDAVQ